MSQRNRSFCASILLLSAVSSGVLPANADSQPLKDAAQISPPAIASLTETAMARPLPYSQKHIDWCLRNHSGYHASDNTYYYSRNFRRACTSPYYRAPNSSLRS